MKPNDWIWPLGLLVAIVGAATFVHYQPHRSGDVAAWVQAVGSIGAIAGAFWIGERQSRSSLKAITSAQLLAERAKRNSILAVAKAARAHTATIEKAFNEHNIRSALMEMYDRSIIDSMVSALNAVPVHEFGSDDAVISFLSLRDHFVFLGNAVDTYLEKSFNLPDVTPGVPEPYLNQVARGTNSSYVKNVHLQITQIDAKFASLAKAVDGLSKTA